MPGSDAQPGWLSTVPTPRVPVAELSDDSGARTAQEVPGGPKLARAVLFAVLCAYAAVQVVDQLTAPFVGRATALTIGIPSLILLFIVTLAVTSSAAGQWPYWRRLVILLVSGLVTYLPMIVLGKVWAGMAGFFAGSALLLLSGWAVWVMFGAVVASMLIIPLTAHFGTYVAAYLTLSTLVTGLVVFGLSRLSLVIKYVHATRGELAQLAVMNERMRFARDLHDLLGYSLSAITLKAELARRLVTSNPSHARDELAEMLDISRQALADVRLVATGYRNISLTKEASSCASLLCTAGIDAYVDVPSETLDEDIDTVLATVMREAVTNMLRHSNVQNCSIEASQTGDTIRLRITNDGAPRSALTGRRGGGLENLATRLRAVGGKLTVTARNGRFDLLAEAPLPQASPGTAECDLPPSARGG